MAGWGQFQTGTSARFTTLADVLPYNLEKIRD